jgi:hypothetical protein
MLLAKEIAPAFAAAQIGRIAAGEPGQPNYDEMVVLLAASINKAMALRQPAFQTSSTYTARKFDESHVRSLVANLW